MLDEYACGRKRRNRAGDALIVKTILEYVRSDKTHESNSCLLGGGIFGSASVHDTKKKKRNAKCRAFSRQRLKNEDEKIISSTNSNKTNIAKYEN